MSGRMIDRPSKARREPVETRAAIGRCPACQTWLYQFDERHECVLLNDGTRKVLR